MIEIILKIQQIKKKNDDSFLRHLIPNLYDRCHSFINKDTCQVLKHKILQQFFRSIIWHLMIPLKLVTSFYLGYGSNANFI